VSRVELAAEQADDADDPERYHDDDRHDDRQRVAECTPFTVV
jgi:hypothetical protein